MPDPAITIGSTTPVIGTLSQEVYTKTAWADEWELTEYLHCNESTWSLFPTLPTATFLWRYGFLCQFDDPVAGIWDRFDRTYRLYVKVIWSFKDATGADKTREWYGVIQLDEDEILGMHAIARLDSGTSNVSGHQTLHAYGMEKLLSDSPIGWAYWWDAIPAVVRWTEVLPDFNRRGIGNRTQEANDNGAYSFEPQTDPVKAVAKYWSTSDIASYLLLRATPVDASDDHAVPFAVGGSNGLSQLTWDRPVVRQSDRTVFACLNDIVHHGRLLAGYFTVADVFGTETVLFNTNTITQADVTIPQTGSPVVPANNRQRPLIFSDDNFTKVVVKRSEIAMYDQVVCRGAPIVCVGSFSIVDTTLAKGWETATEVLYSEGDTAAGYGSFSLTRKREADREFRAQPKFRDVFSKYIVPADWDRQVGDGEGVTSKTMMFLPEDVFAPDDSAQPYYGDNHVLHELPLLMGVDYSLDKIKDGTYDTTPNTDQKKMPPILVWKQPNTTPQRWKEAARYGDAGDLLTIDPDKNNHWSGSISVDGDGHAVRVSITGQQQHVGADNFFDGYKKASDIPVGKLAANTMICTLAIHHGRYCEGRYPANEDVEPEGDLILRKVFNLGDDYTAVYVAPNTVVGVDKDGSLLRSTNGGWIPKTGTDDNISRLAAQAKMLYSYYSRQRRVVDVTSAWFLAEDVLQLGDMITTLETPGHKNYMEVNSFVSSITFRHAQGHSDSRPVPQMHFTTWAGEIDPISPQPWKGVKPAAVYSQGMAEAEAMYAREKARMK